MSVSLRYKLDSLAVIWHGCRSWRLVFDAVESQIEWNYSRKRVATLSMVGFTAVRCNPVTLGVKNSIFTLIAAPSANCEFGRFEGRENAQLAQTKANYRITHRSEQKTD